MKHPALFGLIDRLKHSRRRRILSHAFARTSILALEDYVTKKCHTLMTQFKKRYESGQTTDLLQWFRYFTADVVSKLYSHQRISFSN